MTIVKLSERDFGASIRREQVETLFLLASAVHAHLPHLFNASVPEEFPEWHHLISRLARDFADEIKGIRHRSSCLRIWKRFLNSNLIDDANEPTIEVLRIMQATLEERMRVEDNMVRYIEAANRGAHEWVRSLLRRHGINDLVDETPVPVLIQADSSGKQYCARTSRTSGVITLHFQRGAHALWGALSLEYVLRHEYLSHLVPKSRHLRAYVREGWLTSTLLQEIPNGVNDPLACCGSYLVRKFRKELSAFLQEDEESIFAPLGSEQVAIDIRSRSSRVFWNLNRDILQLDHNRENARQITQLLHSLSRLNDARLEKLVGLSEWPGALALITRLKELT